MQADQPVSAGRGRRSAVLIACRAPDTRFAVAQDARGTILVPQRSEVREYRWKASSGSQPKPLDLQQ